MTLCCCTSWVRSAACCTLKATSTAPANRDGACAVAPGSAAAGSAAAGAPAAGPGHAMSSAPDLATALTCCTCPAGSGHQKFFGEDAVSTASGLGMALSCCTCCARCSACCLQPAAAVSTLLFVGAAHAAASAAGLFSLLLRTAAHAADCLISLAQANRVLLLSSACTAGDLSTAQRACTQALAYLGLVVLGKDPSIDCTWPGCSNAVMGTT